MTWLKFDQNEYGTKISIHKCNFCGDEFTVCPAVSTNAKGWGGCMAPNCTSYDETRDADKLFDEGKVRSRPITLH